MQKDRVKSEIKKEKRKVVKQTRNGIAKKMRKIVVVVFLKEN